MLFGHRKFRSNFPENSIAPSRREKGAEARRPGACLCQSRFPASPKGGTRQGTNLCPAPKLFPGCRRVVQAGGGSQCRGGSLCPRCLRAVLVAHGPSPALGHAPVGVGPVGGFTHVLGRAGEV